jgi:hypothetical protein
MWHGSITRGTTFLNGEQDRKWQCKTHKLHCVPPTTKKKNDGAKSGNRTLNFKPAKQGLIALSVIGLAMAVFRQHFCARQSL